MILFGFQPFTPIFCLFFSAGLLVNKPRSQFIGWLFRHPEAEVGITVSRQPAPPHQMGDHAVPAEDG